MAQQLKRKQRGFNKPETMRDVIYERPKENI